MIRHVAVLKFFSHVSQEQREAAVALMKATFSRIPDILRFEIGISYRPHSPKGDVAQITDFADLDALERFRRHPDHVKYRDTMAKISDWQVVDYYLLTEGGK